MKFVIYQTKALRHPVRESGDSWLTENEMSRNLNRTTFVPFAMTYEMAAALKLNFNLERNFSKWGYFSLSINDGQYAVDRNVVNIFITLNILRT